MFERPVLLFHAQFFRDIAGQHDLGTPAGKLHGVRGDLRQDGAAVLFHMTPDAGLVERAGAAGNGLDQGRDVFRRPDVLDGHGEEFCPGVAVVPDRRVVYREKTQRFEVVGPHRLGVVFEELPVALLGLPQGKLELLALGDVLLGADEVGDPPLRSRDGRNGHLLPEDLAALGPRGALPAPFPPPADHLVQGLLQLAGGLGRGQHHEVLSHQLLDRVSGRRQGARVDVLDGPVRGPDHHRVAALFHDARQFQYLARRLLPVRHVVADPDVAGEIAVQVAEGPPHVEDPAVYPGIVAQPVLGLEMPAGPEGVEIGGPAEGHIVRVYPRHPAVAFFLLQGAAGEVEPGLVEIIAARVGPRAPDQRRKGLEQGQVEIAGALQVLLGLLESGDVPDRFNGGDHLAPVVVDRGGVEQDEPPPAADLLKPTLAVPAAVEQPGPFALHVDERQAVVVAVYDDICQRGMTASVEGAPVPVGADHLRGLHAGQFLARPVPDQHLVLRVDDKGGER